MTVPEQLRGPEHELHEAAHAHAMIELDTATDRDTLGDMPGPDESHLG